MILQAVIAEHALPDDATLAERVNQVLEAERVPEAGSVTGSMVETLRLRWGIQRDALTQALQAHSSTESPKPERVCLGRTQVGGAFIPSLRSGQALAILVVEQGWLKLAHLLPMAPRYAVTATQWLLTSIFAVIFGVGRAFHLDDVCDLGFALVTGRVRPLSHSTFQHWLRAIPAAAAQKFYQASAEQQVKTLPAGTRRVSLDGHNLARYTRVVDLPKGKTCGERSRTIGNTGRILKAEELVLAYDLDARLWLAVRAYQGTKKLTQAIPEIVGEPRSVTHGLPCHALWRFFFDKGGYSGLLFRTLQRIPQVRFYTPAVRYADNVAAWEKLTDADFAAEPFVFDKHAALPVDQQPVYRLADTEMTVNVREKQRVIDTVTLRALVLQDAKGKIAAERWPVVLLTNDRESEARALLNEFGDHWGQEFAHRIGKHDLDLDILPVGYTLRSRRDAQGQLQREVKFDQTAFSPKAYRRGCAVWCST